MYFSLFLKVCMQSDLNLNQLIYQPTLNQGETKCNHMSSQSQIHHCLPTGMNQFNPMAMQNALMSQAPMGARAPSPMNHPQQMNMGSIPSVCFAQFFYLFMFLSFVSPSW